MTAHAAWTPASRPGLIPLHPLTFGTVLGRSFTALRQNPRVLLGFALVTQTVAYLVLLLAIGGAAFASFSRLATLQEGTDEFDAVLAGSIAIVIIVSVVLSLAAGAFNVIIQGVVVTEVAHAAVAERLRLKALWAQLRPVVWRLIGYAFLLALAVFVVIGVVVLAIVALAFAVPALAVILGILVFLAALPLYAWLGVKLVLVPATIILEHARLGEAIGRSWGLTRGRFWSTLGILAIILIGFSVIAQVISIPFSLFGSGLAGIVAPTGEPGVTAIISAVVVLALTQILTLLVQSVALVVQATATSLIYIDCRMRHEGLDLDLLAYVEQRDAGATSLPDPYRVHVGRVIAPRGPAGYPPAGAGYPPYGAPPNFPAQSPAGYPIAPPYAAPPPGAQYHSAPEYPPYPSERAPAAAPGHPPPAPPTPSAASPQAATHPAAPPPAPAPTQWTAPGSDPDGTGAGAP